MAQPLRKESTVVEPPVVERAEIREVVSPSAFERPANQAYRTLQFAFTIVPLLAGLDKFFHILVNWNQYLAPQFPNAIGVTATQFMYGVGVIEIIAGIGVALLPRVFAYIVAIWLLVGPILNLAILGNYDILLRDAGLFFGAIALGQLARRSYKMKRAQTVP